MKYCVMPEIMWRLSHPQQNLMAFQFRRKGSRFAIIQLGEIARRVYLEIVFNKIKDSFN